VVLRLLFFSPLHFGLSPSVVGAASGAAVVAFALLFAIKIEVSAAAFSVVPGPAAFFQQPILGFFARCVVVVAVGVVACCVISTPECAETTGALGLFGRHSETIAYVEQI